VNLALELVNSLKLHRQQRRALVCLLGV